MVKLSKKEVSRRQDEGRGDLSRHLKNFFPFYTDRDTQLRSVRPIIRSNTVNRDHYAQSDLEGIYISILDSLAPVFDIREHGVLDRSTTDAIYKELGFTVPTGPVPLTVDIVYTYYKNNRKRFKPVGIKYVKDLETERVIRNFEVKRIYFSTFGNEWDEYQIMTERDYSDNYVENIDTTLNYFELDGFNSVDEDRVLMIGRQLTGRVLSNPDVPLIDIVHEVDRDFSAPLDPVALRVAYHLIATYRWVLDLTLGPVAHLPPSFKYIASELLP